jgi:hypothetical protein
MGFRRYPGRKRTRLRLALCAVALVLTAYVSGRKRPQGSPPVIMLCHKEWMGIREAAAKMQRATGWPLTMTRIVDAKVVQSLKSSDVVVIHGVPPGTIDAAVQLNSRGVRVLVVYHSGVGVHNVATEEAGLLGRLMDAAQAGTIQLVFLEPDQAQFARALGAPAVAASTAFVDWKPWPIPPLPSPLRIGMLGTGTRLAVKNWFSQAAAACMITGAVIYVTEVPAHDFSWYLRRCRAKLVPLGHLDASTFRRKLGTMHINLYLSWTDALPNVVVDSLSSGVPVLVGDTTSLFTDTDPTTVALKRMLVECRSEDPVAIRDRLIRTLEYVNDHPRMWKRTVRMYLQRLHGAAMQQWTTLVG